MTTAQVCITPQLLLWCDECYVITISITKLLAFKTIDTITVQYRAMHCVAHTVFLVHCYCTALMNAMRQRLTAVAAGVV